MIDLKVIIAFILFVWLPEGIFADIGENFEKGGIGFGGGVSFYMEPKAIFNKNDEALYIKLSINPDIHFFFFKNISLVLMPGITYEHRRNNKEDYSNRIVFDLNTSFTYFFVRKPQAKSGVVPALGLLLGLSFAPGPVYHYYGTKTNDDTFFLYLNTGVVFSINFFLRERVAIILGVIPAFAFPVYQRDADGDRVKGQFGDEILFDVYISIGFKWFIPRKDATLIGNKG